MIEFKSYKECPGYNLLTEEQKQIADRWDRELKTRDHFIEMLSEATKTKDEELWKRALDGLTNDDSNAFMCEHERHWSSNCSECESIEKILRPYLFCEKCEEGLEPEEIEKEIKLCQYCKEDEPNI